MFHMKIREALFKYENKEEILSLEEIKNHEDFTTIITNLYCTYSNCDVPLTYVNGQKSHLRTYREKNHSSDCPHSFDRIAAEKKRKVSETVKSTLSPDMVYSKHEYAFNKYLSTTQEQNSNKYKKKNNNSKKINKNTKTEDTSSITPVLNDTNSINQKSNKASSIPTKHLSVNEIEDKNVNSIVNVFGEVSYINYDETSSAFYLELDSKKNIDIVFPESYLKSAYNEENLKQSFIGISKLFKNQSIFCCITSELQKKEAGFKLPIYSIDKLSFVILDKKTNKKTKPLTPLDLMVKISRNNKNS